MPDPQSSLFPTAVTPDTAPAPFGRDELSLIELAFTTLGRARSRKTLRTEWKGKDHKGRTRKFYKIVTGSDEFGLPEYASEELLIALFHKASRDDFESRSVTAVPYELLQLMGWGTDGRAYERIKRALDQLAGVYITTNALWNPEKETFSKAGFHILDDYEFAEDADSGKTSLTVNWNEKLFAIFRQNRFKSLDTTFFYDLPSPVAKRLYRWLDKHLRNTAHAEIDVLHLAHVKLEVSRSKRYVSSVMQVLEPALDELTARAYCTWSLVDSQTDSGKKLVFDRISTPALPPSPADEPIEALSPDQRTIFDALVERGVTADTARRLTTEHDAERIRPQLDHFDHLVETDQAPRSGGWLVKAITEDFGLPPALLARRKKKVAKREASQQQREHAATEARRRAENAEYLAHQKATLQARLAALSPAERTALEAEAVALLDTFNRRRHEDDPNAPGLRGLVDTNLTTLLDQRNSSTDS